MFQQFSEFFEPPMYKGLILNCDVGSFRPSADGIDQRTRLLTKWLKKKKKIYVLWVANE